MFGKSCYAENNSLLNKVFKEKTALIAAHRGLWGGNVPDNTPLAYNIALKSGADIFECDLTKSSDGIIYLFHEGEEKRLLGITDSLQKLDSNKIDSLGLLNSIGEPSGVPVQRFEDMIARFKSGEIYNVDRAWNILPETFAILNRYPHTINQAIIKSPVEDDILNFIANNPEKYMYMPIVRSMKDVEKVLSYENINTVGMELIAKTSDHELYYDENIQFIKSRNLFVWANAIVLSNSDKNILFGSVDDDLALKKNGDLAWGVMFNKGVDIIQTDWPFLLKEYRDAYFA